MMLFFLPRGIERFLQFVRGECGTNTGACLVQLSDQRGTCLVEKSAKGGLCL